MKKMLLVFLAGALLLSGFTLPATKANAAEALKPLAVVALSSYDELLRDVAFLGKLGDRPEADKALEGLLAMVTQGKGLAGIDKSRPWGIIVQTDGKQVMGCGFLPVTDLKQLVALLRLYTDVKDSGNGVYQVTPRNQNKSLYLKQQGPWAFAAEKPELLARLSVRPMAALAGLEKQYLVGARFYAADAPAEYRDKLFAEIKRNAERDAAQKPGESDQDFALRQKVMRDVLAMLTSTVNDLDEITAGWVLDRKTEKMLLEASFTVRAGTPTAGQVANLGNVTTNFAGFRLPGAAVVGSWAGQIPAAKIDMFSTLIQGGRAHALQDIEKKQKPADETRLAKELVNDVAELLMKTAKSGKCDGGLAVLLDPHAITALGGGYVADSALLDKALHTLAELATKTNPAVAGMVKFDAARRNDVRFHTISVPIPPDAENREKAVQVVGEKLDVVIGLGPQCAYIAAGRDASKTLVQAINASAGSGSHAAAPLELSVGLEPIARFGAALGKEEDRPKAELAANELKKMPGRDHINFTVRPIPRGVQYRVEVEQGIVRLIGRLAALAQPGM